MMDRRKFLLYNLSILGATLGLPYLYQRSSNQKNIGRSFVFLTMTGGPSQMELFDYKPQLYKEHGKSYQNIDTTLIAPCTKFRQHGQTGRYVSDLMPYHAKMVDDLSFIHSLKCTGADHVFGQAEMLTGQSVLDQPYIGAWLNYALQGINNSLPNAFVFTDALGWPDIQAAGWQGAGLPGSHSQMVLSDVMKFIHFLKDGVRHDLHSKSELKGLIETINKHNPIKDGHMEQRSSLYDLALSTRDELKKVFYQREYTNEEQRLYGVKKMGENPLVDQLSTTINLVENNVPYIQIYCGNSERDQNWDKHRNHKDIAQMTKKIDQPIYGFIQMLKRKGLLDKTTVLWGGEFGRTPYYESKIERGRDHNTHANTVYLTGAGIKPGIDFGLTDELGHKAVEGIREYGDIWATILHLFGIDHNKLQYRRDDQLKRLTKSKHSAIEKLLI